MLAVAAAVGKAVIRVMGIIVATVASTLAAIAVALSSNPFTAAAGIELKRTAAQVAIKGGIAIGAGLGALKAGISEASSTLEGLSAVGVT